jgi:hypothetical protein
MDERSQDDDRPKTREQEERERTTTNIILLLIFAALVGSGVWIANGMLDARRADDCIAQGRRNCNPIDVPR